MSDSPAPMHVGVQGMNTTKVDLEFLRRHGVRHMNAAVDDYEADTLKRHREEAAEYGVSLEATHVGIERSILFAEDPERDRALDRLCQTIENAGQAGIRALFYNFTILNHQRTDPTYGRGGSQYSTFDLEQYDNETLSEAGEVSRDEAFERIAYFLERVIPVAEANKVQMACHLDDPPAPVLRGVERWDWPVFEGLKRFAALSDSPYHGFNFCCGVASEGLEDPATELFEIVRYFGERQKIFNVHFRNIRGGLHKFQEVWPDEGDIDMHELARVFRDVGYPYMLMPDHAPGHPDDQPSPGGSGRARQAWAFQFGYIIALIQAVNKDKRDR